MVLMLSITARWRRRRRDRKGNTASLDSSFIFETLSVCLSVGWTVGLVEQRGNKGEARETCDDLRRRLSASGNVSPEMVLNHRRPAYAGVMLCAVRCRPAPARAIKNPVGDRCTLEKQVKSSHAVFNNWLIQALSG